MPVNLPEFRLSCWKVNSIHSAYQALILLCLYILTAILSSKQ
jgi:hypothetical protein